MWKKIEIYKGESDHEAIVIATGDQGAGGMLWGEPLIIRQIFPLWGIGNRRTPLPHHSKNGQPKVSLSPIESPYQFFSTFHKSLISPYCYLKWDIKIKKSLKFEQQKKSINSEGISLKTFQFSVHIFTRIDNLWLWKPATKTLSSPPHPH